MFWRPWGSTKTGRSTMLGVRSGASENATVTTALLEDLVARGIRPDRRRLFVVDGAKALRSAIAQVFGAGNEVQRCRNHKLRNVVGHLERAARPGTGHPRAAWKLAAKEGMRKLQSPRGSNATGPIRCFFTVCSTTSLRTSYFPHTGTSSRRRTSSIRRSGIRPAHVASPTGRTERSGNARARLGQGAARWTAESLRPPSRHENLPGRRTKCPFPVRCRNSADDNLPVVSMLQALPRESKLPRNDPNPTGPSPTDRERLWSAKLGHPIQHVARELPPGVRARRRSPRIDLYRKKVFSTRAWRWCSGPSEAAGLQRSSLADLKLSGLCSKSGSNMQVQYFIGVTSSAST